MKNNNNEYWELMQTFAQIDEVQDPELETPKWKAKQEKLKKAQYADEAKKVSDAFYDRAINEIYPKILKK